MTRWRRKGYDWKEMGAAMESGLGSHGWQGFREVRDQGCLSSAELMQ
jgi:hypothetical protein